MVFSLVLSACAVVGALINNSLSYLIWFLAAVQRLRSRRQTFRPKRRRPGNFAYSGTKGRHAEPPRLCFYYRWKIQKSIADKNVGQTEYKCGRFIGTVYSIRQKKVNQKTVRCCKYKKLKKILDNYMHMCYITNSWYTNGIQTEYRNDL